MIATRRLAWILVGLAVAACQQTVLPSPSGSQSPAPSPAAMATLGTPEGTTGAGGERIVFERADTAHTRTTLFSLSPDGSDEEMLLAEGQGGDRWSPHGGKLLMTASTPSGLIFFATTNPDGSGYASPVSVDPTLNLGCIAWSPDGARLACEGWDDTDPGRNGVYTVRSLDGGDLVRVTVAPAGFHDIPSDYSPDGARILFSRTTDAETGRLIMVRPDGTDEIEIASNGGRAGARWAPDGRSILGVRSGVITMFALDATAAAPIWIAGLAGYAGTAAWSPDGRRIAFSYLVEGDAEPDLFTMSTDGRDVERLTDSPEEEQLGDWAVARSGSGEPDFSTLDPCAFLSSRMVRIILDTDRLTQMELLSAFLPEHACVYATAAPPFEAALALDVVRRRVASSEAGEILRQLLPEAAINEVRIRGHRAFWIDRPGDEEVTLAFAPEPYLFILRVPGDRTQAEGLVNAILERLGT